MIQLAAIVYIKSHFIQEVKKLKNPIKKRCLLLERYLLICMKIYVNSLIMPICRYNKKRAIYMTFQSI